MKFVLNKNIETKIKYFNSVLIIKAGSKCVPQINSKSTIFLVQPFGDEEKDDEWIRHFGIKIKKSDTIQIN